MRVVEIQGLTKWYGPVQALGGIDLAVAEGEVFGLLGPNGAGKTTTVEIIAGLRARDGGIVRVFGLDPATSRRELVHRVALQPQDMSFLENLKVSEIVSFFAALYKSARPDHVHRLLERLGLADRQSARYHQLSGGQKQRLNLVLTLIGDPRLVILDEPTAGLDPQARLQIHDWILQLRQEGRTVLLTTHYIEEAQKLCDRVAILDHGTVIACDTPRSLIARLGGKTRIEFESDGPDELFANLPDVEQRVREGLIHICWTRNPGRTLAGLFQRAESAGIFPRQVQVFSPTLEDVFLSLTGRHFRD